MKQRAPLIFTVTLVLVDAFMAGLSFFLGYQLRLQTDYQEIQPFSAYLGMALVHVISVLIVFFFYRLYHRQRSLSLVDQFYLIFGAASVGTIIAIAFISFFFKNQLDYPRLMIIYTWMLTILLTSLGRAVLSRVEAFLRARGWGEERVLIVGTGEVGRIVQQKIRRTPQLGYRVIGFIDDNPKAKAIQNTPVLGTTDDISDLIGSHKINEVIIAMQEVTHQEILKIVGECDPGRVAVKVFPDVFQIIASEVTIGDLGGLPMLSVRDTALHGWQLVVKRVIDIIGSAAGLVILSPLMLLLAILIKLESAGPVFYTQERMGLDGKRFMMLKFRSMRTDAEKETGPVWTTANDTRRTRLGTFLRKVSIDEFPQFINVFLGEMSLVGPRPERPIFVEQFKRSIPRYMDRHREKAGITGWAQINGLRGDTSIIERTKYDLWYIENWSLTLDFRIIIRTILQLFNDDSAY
ncbi:MAG TPA: undecaprenyl-phosphate glucose phosphotransferase [Anaerolineae bacterium]|nr:undecaprenyl-phosphate glucose phosphotransferase [Anaerolineae bacterium]MCB0226140.1 undecaprenyl-phosphate glucose phosphotransferase [Anaerolineae bacterium]HRV92090.1 undecaprenyl-phosphate glucose phosphotransferase [Anaerolineae bacterium]